MKTWQYTVVVVATVTSIFMTYQYLSANKMKDLLVDTVQNMGDEVKKNQSHYNNRMYELLLNGECLKDNDVVIAEDDETYRLSEIVSDNTLVLRYSELNCNTCIDEQIANLHEYSDSIGHSNIIILATYDRNEYMRRFKKHNKIKFPIYNVSPELNIQLYDIGIPYFFILDKNTFRVNNLFVAQKEYPELTKSYLRNVKRKYFSYN